MVPMIPPIRGYQPVSTSSLLSCRAESWPLRHPRQLRKIPPLSSRLSLYFHCLVIFWWAIFRCWSDKCLVEAGRVVACQMGAVGCNEPFRIPLYKQLRDCRAQSLYWGPYLWGGVRRFMPDRALRPEWRLPWVATRWGTDHWRPGPARV